MSINRFPEAPAAPRNLNECERALRIIQSTKVFTIPEWTNLPADGVTGQLLLNNGTTYFWDNGTWNTMGGGGGGIVNDGSTVDWLGGWDVEGTLNALSGFVPWQDVALKHNKHLRTEFVDDLNNGNGLTITSADQLTLGAVAYALTLNGAAGIAINSTGNLMATVSSGTIQFLANNTSNGSISFQTAGNISFESTAGAGSFLFANDATFSAGIGGTGGYAVQANGTISFNPQGNGIEFGTASTISFSSTGDTTLGAGSTGNINLTDAVDISLTASSEILLNSTQVTTTAAILNATASTATFSNIAGNGSGLTGLLASQIFSNQTANRFYAGPASGAAAAPSFRAVDVADLGTSPAATRMLTAAGSTGTPVWLAYGTSATANSTTFQLAAYQSDARLAANATVNSNVFVNVGALSFAIGASETWSAEFHLTFAGATNGHRYQLTGPASPTSVSTFAHGNASSVSTTLATQVTAFSSVLSGYGTAAFTGQSHIQTCIVNGTNAGTVQLQFATVSGTNLNTILVNSYVTARRLA